MTAGTKARPAIDPRIRARREKVAKDAGRWRRRVAIGALSAMAFGGIAVGLTRSSLLDVDTITIDGVSPRDRETSPDEIVAALGIAVGDRMVELDLGGAAQGVARLPWVDRATVRREWPGRVRVSVTERQPLTYVEFGERYALVDGRRRVLAFVPTRPDGWVELVGVEVPAAAGHHLSDEATPAIAVIESLDAELAERVSQVEIVKREVELVLDSGLVVAFGRAEEVAEKLVALRTMLQQVDLAGASAIDLRVPDTPIVLRGDS